MSVADAGPTPYDRRPWVAERRQQPRRHEEALVHYAKEALIGAALTAADTLGQRTTALDAIKVTTQALVDAGEAYRFAEAQLAVARRVRQSVGVMPEDQR